MRLSLFDPTYRSFSIIKTRPLGSAMELDSSEGEEVEMKYTFPTLSGKGPDVNVGRYVRLYF